MCFKVRASKLLVAVSYKSPNIFSVVSIKAKLTYSKCNKPKYN